MLWLRLRVHFQIPLPAQGEGKRRGGCGLFCNRRDARVRAAATTSLAGTNRYCLAGHNTATTTRLRQTADSCWRARLGLARRPTTLSAPEAGSLLRLAFVHFSAFSYSSLFLPRSLSLSRERASG